MTLHELSRSLSRVTLADATAKPLRRREHTFLLQGSLEDTAGHWLLQNPAVTIGTADDLSMIAMLRDANRNFKGRVAILQALRLFTGVREFVVAHEDVAAD
jgi:hypothetical protein